MIQPRNPTVGHTTKETRIERDTCTPMFIAALFTTREAQVGTGTSKRKKAQINGTEFYNPEMNPNIHGQLIYN